MMTLQELLNKNARIRAQRLAEQVKKIQDKANPIIKKDTEDPAESVESKKETTQKAKKKGQKPANRTFLVVEDDNK